MTTIVTRAGKGSPLTNTELDANFTNLKTTADAALPLSGGTLTGNLKLSDGTEFQLGDSSEFKIKHHASGYTHLQNTVGTLFVDSDSVTFRDDDGSPTNVLINQSGINVTGSVVADNLTLDSGALGPHLSFENVGGSTRIKEANSASFYYMAYDHTFEGHTGIDRLKISNIGDISFYNSAGTSQNLFWDSSTSRLGLGTTVPSTNLTVKNDSNSTSFGSNNIITIQNASTTDNSRMGLAFTGNTNIGSGLALIEAQSYDQSNGKTSLNFSVYSGGWHNDMMVLKEGNASFSGAVSANSSYLTGNTGSATNSLKLIYNSSSGVADFGPDSNGGNTSLNIGTSSSGTFVNALSISSTQNVNIPSGSLMVGSTVAPEGQLTLQNDDAYLRIRSNTTTTKGLTLRYNHAGNFGQLLVDHQGNNQLDMKYHALSHTFGRSDSQQFMTINSSGSVGIGSSLPSSTGVDTGAAKTFIVAPNANFGPALATISDSLGRNIVFANQSKNKVGAIFANDTTVGFGSNSSSTPVTFITGGAERMRLDSSGQLLLGRSANVASGAEATRIQFYNNNSQYDIASIRSLIGAGQTNRGVLTFNVNNGASQQEAMRIDNTGTLTTASGVDFNIMSASGMTLGSTSSITVFKTNNTEAARFDTSQNFLVGTTSPEVHAQSSATGGVITSGGAFRGAANGTVGLFNRINSVGDIVSFFQAGNYVGSISVSASATSYNTSSDQRLKENIADADDSGTKVDAIQVRKFDWKADGSHQDYGMIAQELQAVAPEAVSIPEDEDEMMGVDYSKLVPMLIKEIQSLRQRVAQLEE